MTIDTKDFDDFMVQERLHIGISVKDFKAIVIHADSLKTGVTARYSRSTQPLQLAYEAEGILCEFTLMTTGDFGDSSTVTGPSREASAMPASRTRQSMLIDREAKRSATTSMPPPNNLAFRNILRDTANQAQRKPSPPPASANLDPDSLFLPAEDDQRWDEPNYGDEDEDTLGWDASADNVRPISMNHWIG